MKTTDEFCLILCTCPDIELAKCLAERLVSERLAACVNLFPGVLSVYAWEGEIEKTQEVQLFIKTQAQCCDAIFDFMKAHHPYEVPELLRIPISGGSESYLAWIKDGVGVPQESLVGESVG